MHGPQLMKKTLFAFAAAASLTSATTRAEGPTLEATQKFISELAQGQTMLISRTGAVPSCSIEQYQEQQSIRFDHCNMYFSFDVVRYPANCEGLYTTRNRVEYRTEVPKIPPNSCRVIPAGVADANAKLVSCNGANVIYFGGSAAAQAPRVEKAMNHAIELCKGQGVPW